jgi:hypothetical protein
MSIFAGVFNVPLLPFNPFILFFQGLLALLFNSVLILLQLLRLYSLSTFLE